MVQRDMGFDGARALHTPIKFQDDTHWNHKKTKKTKSASRKYELAALLLRCFSLHYVPLSHFRLSHSKHFGLSSRQYSTVKKHLDNNGLVPLSAPISRDTEQACEIPGPWIYLTYSECKLFSVLSIASLLFLLWKRIMGHWSYVVSLFLYFSKFFLCVVFTYNWIFFRN